MIKNRYIHMKRKITINWTKKYDYIYENENDSIEPNETIINGK